MQSAPRPLWLLRRKIRSGRPIAELLRDLSSRLHPMRGEFVDCGGGKPLDRARHRNRGKDVAAAVSDRRGDAAHAGPRAPALALVPARNQHDQRAEQPIAAANRRLTRTTDPTRTRLARLNFAYP